MKKLLGIVIVLLLLPVMSYGQLVTIQIEATVNYLDDYYNLLQGKVALGSTITGTYTYDTSTTDTSPIAYIGTYFCYNYPCGVMLSTNGMVFSTNFSDVEFKMGITNNGLGTPPPDVYGFVSYKNQSLSNSVQVESIALQLNDYSGTAITSTALSTTAPVLSDWDYSTLSISGGSGGTAPCYEKTFDIKANVTSVVLIPEPISIVLFGFGLLALRKQK